MGSPTNNSVWPQNELFFQSIGQNVLFFNLYLVPTGMLKSIAISQFTDTGTIVKHMFSLIFIATVLTTRSLRFILSIFFHRKT